MYIYYIGLDIPMESSLHESYALAAAPTPYFVEISFKADSIVLRDATLLLASPIPDFITSTRSR